MKITTAFLPLVLATSAAARSAWFSSTDVTTQAETLPVAGDNPLLFCDNPKDYILEIEKVDLSPNPPAIGKSLVIKAKGKLSEDIEEGAKVHIEVKYGLIKILNQNIDLCEQVKQVDLECPLKKGEMELTKAVDLPNEVPPGRYTVLADVTTKDGDKITCLTATVIMKHGGALIVEEMDL